MSSEPTPSDKGKHVPMRASYRFFGRRTRRVVPWLLWGSAIAVCIYFGRGVIGLQIAPGEAEAVVVAMAPQHDARILEVLKSEGEAVTQGEPLVRFDAARDVAELAVARAELIRLQLEVPAQEKALLEVERDSAGRLADQYEDAALDVVRIEAEMKRDAAELGQLDVQLKRAQDLVAQKLASAELLQTLQRDRASLAQKVAESGQLLAAAQRNAASARRRQNEQREAIAKSPQENSRIAPYRAAIAAQEERVTQLEAEVQQATLLAPFDGTVAEQRKRPGEVARPDEPILLVVKSVPERVIAYVDERWARRVKRGSRARMQPSDGMGKIIEGKVVALGGRIAELPVRFRKIPTEPAFGRRVVIDISPGSGSSSDVSPVPGQAFNVTFRVAETK